MHLVIVGVVGFRHLGYLLRCTTPMAHETGAAEGQRHRTRATPPHWWHPSSRKAQFGERRGKGTQLLWGWLISKLELGNQRQVVGHAPPGAAARDMQPHPSQAPRVDVIQLRHPQPRPLS